MNLTCSFRGCLLGALFGDCLGAPFEGERRAAKSVLNSYFAKMSDKSVRVPLKPYTDDAAMTKALAQSLIDKGKLNTEDLSQKFVREFFEQPNRGYGRNVVDVFAALKATKFKDVFAPAAIQFDGNGSYGNGGAMRVSPVALFCYEKSAEEAIRMAKESALITHSNRLGVNGAVLQCLAIHQAINTTPSSLDPAKYLDSLSEQMRTVEKFQSDELIARHQPEFVYVKSLEIVKDLLERKESITYDEIEERLGTGIAAHQSVPTAIFVFLRSFTTIDKIETTNPFQRTLHFAISLGGDTDTIASMAGAIAGAYYGSEKIPEFLHSRCEATDVFIKLADDLLKTAMEASEEPSR